MRISVKLPVSLPALALLPALLLSAAPAMAAQSSSQRLDSSISAAHGTLDESSAESGADTTHGDAAAAQASRALSGNRGGSARTGQDDDADTPSLPLNQGGQPVTARSALDQRRRQAQAALNRQDPARALSIVDRALQEAPGDARLRFLKGLSLFQLGRLPDAEREFTGLIEEYPELPEPYNNLAVVRAAQGHLEGARDALEAAIRAVPDYAVAYRNLGDLYLQLAAQRWRKAQKLAPDAAQGVRLKALDALLEPAPAAPASRSGLSRRGRGSGVSGVSGDQ